MKKTWFSMLAVLALAMAIVSPAFAAKSWDLNIHNNTEEDVKVYLYGPDDYSFTVHPGKTAKSVLEGSYDYKYSACGQKFEGTIEVKDNFQWLDIARCGEVLDPETDFVSFVVNSQLGESLTLTLTPFVPLPLRGTYAFSVSLGQNVFRHIPIGDYTYTYTACGGENSGVLRITKAGMVRYPPDYNQQIHGLTLYSCELMVLHPEQGLSTGLPAFAPSNLRIGSRYSFPIRLTVLGLVPYSIVVDLGLNRFNVQPGDYTFTYTAYGQFHSGSFTVPVDGAASFTISPVP